MILILYLLNYSSDRTTTKTFTVAVLPHADQAISPVLVPVLVIINKIFKFVHVNQVVRPDARVLIGHAVEQQRPQ